jgi:hypothetical protein
VAHALADRDHVRIFAPSRGRRKPHEILRITPGQGTRVLFPYPRSVPPVLTSPLS